MAVSRAEERLSAGAALIAILAVGVAVFFASVPGDLPPVVLAWWWISYVVYLGVFVLDSGIWFFPPHWPSLWPMAILFVSGLSVWLLAPALGWTGVLFVTTAAAAAYTLSSTVVIIVIAIQSVAIAVGGATIGTDVATTVFSTLVYLSFQIFAALVVTSAQREATARATLAIAHRDLEATTALLAVTTRNDERLRIGRDLHDVVGHELTALTLALEVASHQSRDESNEQVILARGIAKNLLAHIRDIVSELRDAQARLEPTLRELIANIPGLAVALKVEERRCLDDASNLSVIRCVQEILTNTIRHSAASHLSITIISDGDGFALCAHDDGRGASHVTFGNGLTGMAERIEALGGTLKVESAPGAGFTVALTVPT